MSFVFSQDRVELLFHVLGLLQVDCVFVYYMPVRLSHKFFHVVENAFAGGDVHSSSEKRVHVVSVLEVVEFSLKLIEFELAVFESFFVEVSCFGDSVFKIFTRLYNSVEYSF